MELFHNRIKLVESQLPASRFHLRLTQLVGRSYMAEFAVGTSIRATKTRLFQLDSLGLVINP